MKASKKILSVILALISVCLICAPAFAEGDILIYQTECTVPEFSDGDTVSFNAAVPAGSNYSAALRIFDSSANELTAGAKIKGGQQYTLVVEFTPASGFSINFGSDELCTKCFINGNLVADFAGTSTANYLITVNKDESKIDSVELSVNTKHGTRNNRIDNFVSVASGKVKYDRWYAEKPISFFENETFSYTKKLYASNEYTVMVFFEPETGCTFEKNVTVTAEGAKVAGSTIRTSEDGTYKYLAVQLEFEAQGNFFQKIITFFHNLFTPKGTSI